MAKVKSKPALPSRDNGDPDVLGYMESNEVGIIEAAEAFGIGIAKAHKLMWAQEVEDDPSLKVKLTGDKLTARVVKLREDGVRWERISARTGLPVSELKGLYESSEGEGSSKRERAESENGKAATKTKVKAGRKAKAPVEDDEDEEDEEPETKPATRRPRRRASRAS